jgi:serine/threonine-protein kinase
MAMVFRAWDHRLDRPVAIKALRDLENAEARAVERFRREARACAALRSRHIVEVYDYFEELGRYYLVMELVEGANLKERLLRQPPLTHAEALGIAAQVCEALEVAHAHGYIHRDIKPQNVLLGANGDVKLTDFGIVHLASDAGLTTGGIVLGTADYISPEQAQGLELRPSTDVYSLGVVLYEMLTGILPFRGTTPIAVAMKHATASVPAPRLADPTIPAAVERVVLRALEKEPGRRYASAREMGAALRQAMPARGHLRGAVKADTVKGSQAAWRLLAERLLQPEADDADDEELADACEYDDTALGRAVLTVGARDADMEASRHARMQQRLVAVLSITALMLIGIVFLRLVI